MKRRAVECAVFGGNYISRTVCVLTVGLASLISVENVAAQGRDQLFQRQPDRLLIESSRRVSDGRKLQKDADTNFRRAEGGVELEGEVEGERSGTAAVRGGAESGGSGNDRAATERGAVR